MKRRIYSVLLCLLFLTGLFPKAAFASSDWPSGVSIEADAGIVMDARTGTVLYGKNIHETYAPASITKVLTALIVLEECEPDEIVTFSQNAVYNVEENSSSAGYDTGDSAYVKDLLYALLLKSANEAANALAEHVAGTTEDFAVLMNKRAAAIGCVDSHFANPSGLNADDHYVSAYDMALITREAFRNDTFAEIVGTPYYMLPPNRLNPEGQGISPGNKMIKKNWPDQYRPDVLGGKTGYTSIALNTLVNGAQQGETRLVTAVLHSHATQYEDTARLLDFGFDNFEAVRIADCDRSFADLGSDLQISGLTGADSRHPAVDPESYLILPKTADFSETTKTVSYDLPAGTPDGVFAQVHYFLGDREVGQAGLKLEPSRDEALETLPEALLRTEAPSEPEETGEEAQPEEKSRTGRASVSPAVWISLAAAAVLAAAGTALYFLFDRNRRREAEARLARQRRREERLRESGMSRSEFEHLMEQRRQASFHASAEAEQRRNRRDRKNRKI